MGLLKIRARRLGCYTPRRAFLRKALNPKPSTETLHPPGGETSVREPPGVDLPPKH